MRALAVFACAAASVLPLPIASAQTVPETAAIPRHPPEVAFVGEGEKGYVYRKFPTGERLYVSDRDGPGRSVCNGGCASAWPPVYAPAEAAAVGDWTVVQRSDGRTQWALNGRPVYTRFHDTAEVATGDGVDGVWHLVDYTRPAE
ncbi:MAG TPA: hypothetical protein VF440_02515 [Novosphingobium sp.]